MPWLGTKNVSGCLSSPSTRSNNCGFKYFLHGVETTTTGRFMWRMFYFRNRVAHVLSGPKRQVNKRLWTTWIRRLFHFLLYIPSFNSFLRTAKTSKYWRESQDVAFFSTTSSKSTFGGSSNLVIIIFNNTRVYLYIRKRVPSIVIDIVISCKGLYGVRSVTFSGFDLPLAGKPRHQYSIFRRLGSSKPLMENLGFVEQRDHRHFFFSFCGALCTH